MSNLVIWILDGVTVVLSTYAVVTSVRTVRRVRRMQGRR